MIMYPKQFFEQETRRGFTISEVMKRSWAADMDMIISLSQICEQHSLRFFACYGTLLGAVREHGYIPWDDDIDIGLLRDDYIRLLDILESGYSDYFNVLNPYTRSWYHMNFSHITNGRTTSYDRKYLEDWHGCPFMTGPDVFPYYYIPRDVEKEKVILGLLERIDSLIAMNKESQDRLSVSGKFDDKDRLNEIIATELVELQKDTGYKFTTDRPLENQLEILYDQVCRVTQKEEADFVCRYDEYCKDRTKKFPKEYFEYTIDIPFELINMPVMIGYDAVLRARFGNNYIIPKQENAAHDYPYYKKQLNENEYYEKQLNYIELGKSKIQTLDWNRLEHESIKKEKRILYHTSVREMLIHCDCAIESIRSKLDHLLKNNDISLVVWMPDELLNTDDCALGLTAPTLLRDFDNLVEYYRKQNIEICNIVKKNEVGRVINFFDEYYGDEGFLAEGFRNLGKSVFIQEYVKNNELYMKYNHKCLNIPNDDNTGRKKKVLYITSLSVLFQNRDNITDKIRRVLDNFYQHKDEIVLIWKAQDIQNTMSDAFGEEFIRNYLDILEQYKKDGLEIIMDSDIEMDEISAIYGDPDALMMNGIEQRKPVMIQNPNI